ncbi:MAG: group 1 truncated hemoglobin [Alteromonadaceae bacterium]|nr:MAG: group 1 truncated hemoglobin [Alteromonadaceae bacterium]
MSESLFVRLGGNEGIKNIVNDLVDLHAGNKTISNRFIDSDLPALKKAATEFFIAGTGGEGVYKGKDLKTAHRGMNISPTEFMAGLDDALDALERNNVGQREREEVLFVLYSMRKDVMGVCH